MSVPSQQTTFTPEDLLHMPDGNSYELVNGQLVEKNMGFESSFIGGQLFLILANFCYSRGLGWVLPADTSYQCFSEDPTKVRKPDVSFLASSKLVGDRPKGHCKLVPDLVVEVVSPNDEFSQISTKVHEYLDAGVRLVWVVDPVGEEVLVYRGDDTRSMLASKDQLDGEDVVPGFRCLVADLFKPPAGVVSD
jgi:Uma2 family endonuclease